MLNYENRLMNYQNQPSEEIAYSQRNACLLLKQAHLGP